MKDLQFDSVVIGGGAAGMAAALELDSAGFSCAIVEREDEVGHAARSVQKRGGGREVGHEVPDGHGVVVRAAGKLLPAVWRPLTALLIGFGAATVMGIWALGLAPGDALVVAIVAVVGPTGAHETVRRIARAA